MFTQAAVLDIYVEIARYLKNVEYAIAPNADIMNTIENISKYVFSFPTRHVKYDCGATLQQHHTSVP